MRLLLIMIGAAGFVCGTLVAQTGITVYPGFEVSNEQNQIDLLPSAKILMAEDGNPEKDLVLAGSYNGQLIPVLQSPYYLKNKHIPENEGWLQFEIKSSLNRFSEWVFFPISRIHSVDRLEVFISGYNGQWDSKITGKMVPYSLKNDEASSSSKVRNSHYGISLDLDPGEEKIIWVHYRNRSGPKTTFEPVLLSTSFFIAQNERYWSKRNLIQGLFFGMLLMVTLFSLVRWVVRKDKTYLMYALFIISLAFVVMGLPGIRMFQVFLFEHPVFSDFLSTISEYTVVIFYILFILNFLDLKKLLPGWHKIILWLLYLYIVILLVRSFFYWFSLYENVVYIINLWLYLLVFSLLLFLFFRLILTRDIVARYLVIGSGILVVGGIIHVLEILEVIRLPWSNEFVKYPSVFLIEGAIVLELITFSLGLGYRAEIIEKEKSMIEARKEQQTKYFENVSHEIQNPLSLIYSALDNLARRRENGKSLSQLETIERSSDKIRKLVRDLLTMARIDAGHLQLQASKTDLGKFVRNVCINFKAQAQHHSIIFEVITPDEPLYGFIDPDMTEKILTNLISNAFKHTPEGKKVTVSTIHDPQNRQVGISVWNQGKSIPKEYIDKIFLRFFTLDHEKGSGIGLSLCKELVKLQKGIITVNSQQGHGTIFEFRIPTGKDHLQPEEITDFIPQKSRITKIFDKATSSAKDNVLVPKKEECILIVEDDKELRKDLANYLKSHGYETLEAMDGEEGFQIAKEKIPNLIITDLWMPRKNGLELTRQLKKEELTSHIPIVLLTAEEERDKIISLLKEGVVVYLPKPVRFQMLLANVRSLSRNLESVITKFGREELYHKLPAPESEFINKVEKAIESRMDDETLKATVLHQDLFMSRSQLHKKLEAITGFNTSKFLSRYRLKKGKILLQDQNLTVSEVSVMVGFRNLSYFIKKFKDQYGMTPNEYKNSLKDG